MENPGGLDFRQGHACLPLVFAGSVLVRGFTLFVRFEEQHLGATLACIDLGWQGRGVAEFQGDITFPFGFKRCDIHDDAAAGIGGLAQTDRQDATRNAEILHGACQRERVRRNDAVVAVEFDKGVGIEILRVDNRAVDISENFEFIGAADIVTIAGGTVGDDLLAIDLADQLGLEWFYHAVLFSHATYPLVGFDTHVTGFR